MAEWTRGSMRREFLDGGFHYLENSSGRANRILERAMGELISEHQFPFREREQEVVPGEALAGLGQVEQVTRSSDGRVLEPVRFSTLREQYRSMEDTGEPLVYYQWGQDTIRVYPTTEEPILVHHYSLARWRAAGSGELLVVAASDDDQPILPFEYVDLAMTLARAIGKEDVDNRVEADSLRRGYETRLEAMRATLISRQVDEPQRIRVTQEWA